MPIESESTFIILDHIDLDLHDNSMLTSILFIKNSNSFYQGSMNLTFPKGLKRVCPHLEVFDAYRRCTTHTNYFVEHH